jgi:hypothetical protein
VARFPPVPFPLVVPGAVLDAFEVRAAALERVPRPADDVDLASVAFFWA